MMLKLSGLVLAAAGLAALATACAASGAGGRQITITQRSEGCTPTSVSVTPGEKLQFVVKNDADADYEFEGIEGTKIEEVVVPKGRTRKIGYTVPSGGGTHKVKCYVPAGVSTIIELVARDGGQTPAGGGATSQPEEEPEQATTPDALKQPDATVAVTLTSYTVTADKASVPSGVIRFIATNASADQVHELAVLRVHDDGARENLGEIEDIEPGQGGTVTVGLAPGKYELACLLVPGEAGSTVDHYRAGMHTGFTVE